MYTDDSIPFVKYLFCFFVLTHARGRWLRQLRVSIFLWALVVCVCVCACISSENKTEIKFTKKKQDEEAAATSRWKCVCARSVLGGCIVDALACVHTVNTVNVPSNHPFFFQHIFFCSSLSQPNFCRLCLSVKIHKNVSPHLK